MTRQAPWLPGSLFDDVTHDRIHGAWLPLLIGLTAFTVMTTWQRGREIVTAERAREEGPLPEFIADLRSEEGRTLRVPGTAVFLNRGKQSAPLAMRVNVEHNHVRHDRVVILSIETETEPVPRVRPTERSSSTTSATPTTGSSMSPPGSATWRHRTYPAHWRCSTRPKPKDRCSSTRRPTTCRRSSSGAGRHRRWRPGASGCSSPPPTSRPTAAEYFSLPRDRTVIMGSHIEV